MDPTDPLEGRFSGKRKADRIKCQVAIVIRSGRRQFPAELLDLSSTGALLRISYESVSGAIGGRRAGKVIDSVDRHFGGGGFEIEFPSSSLVLPAVLVRMVMEVNEPDAFRLGCQFKQPISDETLQSVTGPTPPAR